MRSPGLTGGSVVAPPNGAVPLRDRARPRRVAGARTTPAVRSAAAAGIAPAAQTPLADEVASGLEHEAEREPDGVDTVDHQAGAGDHLREAVLALVPAEVPSDLVVRGEPVLVGGNRNQHPPAGSDGPARRANHPAIILQVLGDLEGHQSGVERLVRFEDSAASGRARALPAPGVPASHRRDSASGSTPV